MLQGADATDNPVASDKPAPGGETEDTNAVASPAHTDFLLTRLGGAYVALPTTVPITVLIGAALIVKIALTPAFSLLPLLVSKHFGGDAAQLSLLEAVAGVGIVAGGLVLTAWS